VSVTHSDHIYIFFFHLVKFYAVGQNKITCMFTFLFLRHLMVLAKTFC